MAESTQSKTGAVLVVGGGIGGMQAALDLSNSGFKVYLAERSPAIGGVMAQLDKTFPTNDCAMCTMAPRLVEVGRQKDIEVITLADVRRIEGEPGNFTVTLDKKARFIDIDKCTGCGECSEVCPVNISSEFDLGLIDRKATYRPYPQAYPNTFAIDKQGSAPCRNTCPAGVNVQGFVALLAEGRFDEALEVYRRRNPFPATCGRICTHPCQEACNRSQVDENLGIRDLHRFLADREMKLALEQPVAFAARKSEDEEKAVGRGADREVAIVGSGPAGLTCAWELAHLGYSPVVFESLPVAGGMLRVGIPRYRLPIDVLDFEIEGIKRAGVEIRLSTPVGPDLRLDDLFDQGFEAIFIAIGTHQSRRLGIEGEDLEGVIHGTGFLQQVKMERPADVAGKTVVVIGGGNAAMDSARTALRLAARQVTVLYRRSREEMPARDEEIAACEEEGIVFRFLASPIRMIGDAGKVIALECDEMQLGEPDASGRRRPVPVQGSTFQLPADIVIPAVSQEGDVQSLMESVTTVQVTETGMVPISGTELKGVRGFTDLLRAASIGEPVDLGERVIIIGGGNVAVDVARTIIRLGIKDVTLACLESYDEMPAFPEEVKAAGEEGIKILNGASPKRIVGKDGHATGVEFRECLSVFDAEGRFSPVVKPDSEEFHPAETVVIAIGQTVDWGLFKGADGVLETKAGFISADKETMVTNVKRVFAGGDVVTGPDVVVQAIVAGQRAAVSIDRFLHGEDLREGREDLRPPRAQDAPAPVPPGPHIRQSRVPMSVLPVEERVHGFAEVEMGYSEEEAMREANRCLHCTVCSECLQCVEACKADAIDHDMEDSTVSLDVGAVVLAPGFTLYDTDRKIELGSAWLPDVVTSLQFERILSASGPYEGQVVRPSNGKHAERIAFVQCVGSREEGHDYCSSVCCMYATKEAIIAMEHQPGLECTIFFMDLRAFGKGFDAYYERAKELGVRFIRCRPSSVELVDGTGDLRVGFIDEQGHPAHDDFDLVVLSAGLQPNADIRSFGERVGVEINRHGFASTRVFSPVESSRPGVFVCGAFSEPKDIPESVTDASGAAAQAMSLLAESRHTLVTQKEYPLEKDVSGQRPRIGVFVCHCGRNIGGFLDVPATVEFAKTLSGVVYAEHNLYTCSSDTQDRIKELIEEHSLNRVIVASCTPRTHEPLFRDTIREAGLNPYLFEMANIRDQCSWVHMHEPESATAKAKELVRMAVAKARLIEPLHITPVPVTDGALVIGGGIAGMTAALNLADQGFAVHLVEREAELGGHLRHIRYLVGGASDPQVELAKVISRVEAHPNITVRASASVRRVDGFVGNFVTTIAHDGQETLVEHGVVIVATGAAEHTPTEYRYGSDERVITQHELEDRLAEGKLNVKRVVMIQCVGSREGDRMYCSRVCCTQAVKNALKIKTDQPGTDVYVLYRDLRTYGFREEYYTLARRSGVRFLRYEPDRKPHLSDVDGRLRVEAFDPVLNAPLEIDADLLVLAPPIVPREDAAEVAQMLKVPLTSDGFFLEAHMKLRPIDFSADGIFLAGMAHSPKGVDETIAQAQATAARAATILSKDEYTPEAIIASVDEEVCAGCGLCVSVCSYDAPELVTVRGRQVSRINQALCKGCGACASACPSGAMQQLGFRPKQVVEMVSAALECE